MTTMEARFRDRLARDGAARTQALLSRFHARPVGGAWVFEDGSFISTAETEWLEEEERARKQACSDDDGPSVFDGMTGGTTIR